MRTLTKHKMEFPKHIYKVIILGIIISMDLILVTCYSADMSLDGSINRVAVTLYNKAAELGSGNNIIISPLSIQIAFSLLSLGARDETLKQLLDNFHLHDEDWIKTVFSRGVLNLMSAKGVELNIANKIYLKDDPKLALNDEFKKNAIEFFKSDVENINFGDSNKAVSTINEWVESKTNRKIQNLLPPNSVGGSTILALINAIYFKGTWSEKFDKSKTREEDFYINSNSVAKVQMMHQEKRMDYADLKELDAQAVEIFYEKNDMSMVILLPNEIDGIKKLEESLSFDTMTIFSQMKSQIQVDLSLPRFKIEHTLDLNQILSMIGITRIFEGDAQLDGLIKNPMNLSVTKAVHKAFIEVNEEGTEAAAATGIVVGITSVMPSDPKIFNANHPFIYVLKSSTDEILFIGKFENENGNSKDVVVENNPNTNIISKRNNKRRVYPFRNPRKRPNIKKACIYQ